MEQMTLLVEVGNRAQEAKLKKLLEEGWAIKSQAPVHQGYAAGKTCCLGYLFLPLALLGRKKPAIQYVLERQKA